MKMTKSVPENDLLKRGVEILFRELGKYDAIRFLTIPREKRIESVERHRKWQDTLNKDSFFDEIFSASDQRLL
ncbi:MAG: hypothetical protein U5R49_06790 [Deltaproteobacteria bacterium]|nr:hypothetical protein [Deltaproteobacteria bacterium]